MPVIDHHDDLCESFLASVDMGEASEVMKVSSWKESADLLDRDFALIMVDELGREHRKFACFDPGNAMLSEWYLLNVENGLPEDATKLAAANIANALESFGLGATMTTLYWGDAETGADSRRVKVASSSLASAFRDQPSTLKKTASAFDYVAAVENDWDDLDPYDRHEAAVNLVKVASSVGATVPGHIFKYSGTALNPLFKKIAEARTHFARDLNVAEGYMRLSKMAGAMDPDDVVEAMYLLDEQAQINHRYGDRLPDPVLSVYGTTKEAEYSWIQGGDYVTASMLNRYAGSMASNTMGDLFSESIKDSFRKDPVTTFKKMPEEQQILVARLASQSRDTNNGGY
jgi:hypothetical protein